MADPTGMFQRSMARGSPEEALYPTWGPKLQGADDPAGLMRARLVNRNQTPSGALSPEELERVRADTLARIDAKAAQLGATQTTAATVGAAASEPSSLVGAVAGPTTVGAAVVAGIGAAMSAAVTAMNEEEQRRRLTEASAAHDLTYNTIIEGVFDDPSPQAVYTLRFYEDWPIKDNQPNAGISVDLPYVNRVAMTAPNAVVRTRGMDGTVYAEHAAIPERTFVIEGRSGAISRPTRDAEAGLDIRRFTNLRNLIETYAATSARNKSALVRFKDSRLILDFSFEDEAYFCEVVDFQYRRSTETSTYSFEYTLTLVTNAPHTRVAEPISLKSWEAAANVPKPLGNATPGRAELEADTEAFNRRVEQEFIEKILRLDSFRRGAEQSSRTTNPLESFTCDELYDLRAGITVLNGALDNTLFTYALRAGVRARIKTFLAHNSYALDLVHSLKGSNSSGCPVPPWTNTAYRIMPYTNLVTEFIRMLNPARAEDTMSMQVYLPYRPGFLPALPANPAQGPEEDFVVPQGMTSANDIADFWFGDASMAWRIIDLNRMRDAYTFGDGTPLAPSSVIRLPSPALPVAKNGDVLGTDLMLENGDLVLVGFNDVKRISGYANYSQNLLNRMQTFRGHNKVFPNYGLPDNVLSSAGSTIPATIRTQVKDQIRQDHRTAKVERTTLNELGDKVQVDVLVKPIAGPKGRLTFYYNLDSGVTP